MTNIRHSDIIVESDNPFKNCKLNRGQYAKTLTQIVGSANEGFVLAINNEWGAGKTTFVRMWKQQMDNEGFQTLYFNAWESDCDSNPLTALLAELKCLNSRAANGKKNFPKLLRYASIIGRNIVPIIVNAIAEKYIPSEPIKTFIGGITEDSLDAFEKEVDEYLLKKDALRNFKRELATFVQSSSSNKPVVFIIDELDRCKPDYAVNVLEQIKHFFSVPGIVFVLSIDKVQLCSSIRGFYGSDSIDAESYLRRFIDIEYQIPKPQIHEICEYFYQYYKFTEFFELREQWSLEDDTVAFKDFIRIFCTSQSVSMRTLEKIFSVTRLILRQYEPDVRMAPDLLFLLIFLKEYNREVYLTLSAYKYNDKELIANVYPVVENMKSITNENYVAKIVAKLILAIYVEKGVELSLLLKTRFKHFAYPDSDDVLYSALMNLEYERNSVILLSDYTKKIDLMDPIVF